MANEKQGRGLSSELKNSFNFNKPKPLAAVADASAAPVEKIPTATEPTVQNNQITRVVGKIGRPKGAVTKVKKTFYLTSGISNLKDAQIALVKQAGVFIKDESEVADLALAVLARTMADPAGVKQVVEVYNQEIKK